MSSCQLWFNVDVGAGHVVSLRSLRLALCEGGLERTEPLRGSFDVHWGQRGVGVAGNTGCCLGFLRQMILLRRRRGKQGLHGGDLRAFEASLGPFAASARCDRVRTGAWRGNDGTVSAGVAAFAKAAADIILDRVR